MNGYHKTRNQEGRGKKTKQQVESLKIWRERRKKGMK
jgi:hypothetical protein